MRMLMAAIETTENLPTFSELYPYDQHWYPDSGATQHMTADDGHMINRISYQSTEHVAV
ncbi:hypothetical protein MKW92_014187, partial [Papaver armeniacum]